MTAEPWCALGTPYSNPVSGLQMSQSQWPSLPTNIAVGSNPGLFVAHREFTFERPHFVQIAEIISFATPQYTGPVTIFLDSRFNSAKAHISNFRAKTLTLLLGDVMPLVQWRENDERDVAIIFKIEYDGTLSQLTYQGGGYEVPGQIWRNPVMEWSAIRLDHLKELFLALRQAVQGLTIPYVDSVGSSSDNGQGHRLGEEYRPSLTELSNSQWGYLALCYQELFPFGNCYEEFEQLSTFFEVASSTKG